MNKYENFIIDIEESALGTFKTLREAVDYVINGDKDILYDYLESGESLIDLYKDYEDTIYAHTNSPYPRNILLADMYYVLDPSTLLYIKEKHDML